MAQLRRFPAWLVVPVALILFYPLFAGRALFWGLPAMQFVPWQQFAYEELAAGRLPLWNPYAGAGAPLIANYQTAFFYPPNWLHLVLPAYLGLAVVGVLHLIWAAWGMWKLAGELGAPAFGRTISALAFPFSGYIIARFGTPPMVYAAAWLPWLFWAVHRLTESPTRKNTAILALVAAMQFLTGHAQLTFYALLGVGLYALWRAVEARRAALLTWMVAGIALGAAIAAIQLLPTTELLQTSQRAGGLDYDFLMNFSYNPLRILGQLTPHFFGTPADGSYQGKGAYWEDAAYIGLLPLALALLAFFVWLKRRKRPDRHPALAAVPFFALLGAGAFVLALGKHAPFGLYDFLYHHVPTFAMFQGPARWLILTVFCLSLLAGVGVVGWGRGKWTFYFARLATAGGVGIVILALVAPGYIPENAALEALVAAMVALGGWMVGVAVLTLAQPAPEWGVSPRWWQAAVILFVAVDLAWAWQSMNPTAPAAFYDPLGVEQEGRAYWFDAYEEYVAFGDDDGSGPAWFRFDDFTVARDDWQSARRTMLPNMNLLDHVAYLNNFDPMRPGDHVRYLDIIESLGPARAGALLRAAGVDAIYTLDEPPGGWDGNLSRYVHFQAAPPGWTRDSNDPHRWLAPEPAPRAWLVSEVKGFANQDAMEAYMLSGAWEPARTVLIEGQNESSGTEVGNGKVEVIEDTHTQLRLHAAADGPAWLVLADTWYPGWTATVDGAPVEVLRANLAFRAVELMEGEHEVVFSYSPSWLLPGALLSLVGLAVCAALWFWRGRA